MDNQIWSFVLTAVGLVGFYLAGKKVWWCWYINIFNQVLWSTYAFATEQWGFLIGTFFYSTVFTKNAIEWTHEHLEKKRMIASFQKAVKSGRMSVNDVRKAQGLPAPYTTMYEEIDNAAVFKELWPKANPEIRKGFVAYSGFDDSEVVGHVTNVSQDEDGVTIEWVQPDHPDRCGLQNPDVYYPYYCIRKVDHKGPHGYGGVFWYNDSKPHEHDWRLRTGWAPEVGDYVWEECSTCHDVRDIE